MINFASLFNQYRASSNNSINDLLSQQDTTLSQLLDEQSFLNEYKSNNSRLIQFLKYQKMRQLVDIITIIGPQSDKKRSYKYPLTVSEILTSDNQSLLEWFLPEGKIYEEHKIHEEQQLEIEIQDDSIDQHHEQNHQTQTENKENSTETANIQQKNNQTQEKTIINDTLDNTTEEDAQKINNLTAALTLNEKNAEQNQQQTSSDTKTESSKKDQNIKAQSTIVGQHAKRFKKLKKVVIVQKTQRIQASPLIFQLCQYFQSEVNYILTGYVCKVLTYLFSKRAIQMMEFLFTENRIQSIVKHIQSRSVGQFLLKVMTHQSNKFVNERAAFFKEMLLKIAGFTEIHVLTNFSSFISETIEKAAINIKSANPLPQFSTIFFTPQIIMIVITNVMSDQQNVSVYSSPILLSYLTNVPFNLPQNQAVITQFKELLKMCIQKSLEKLQQTSNRPKLGYGRVKILQILTYILKQNLLECRQIFGQQKRVFQILFGLCRKYQLNNVLHNEVVKILTIAFTDKQPSRLSQALIQNDFLVSFLSEEAKEDDKIRTSIKNGKKILRKGYIGHVVQISRLIQQHEKTNSIAQQISGDQRFQEVLLSLVQRQIHESNKSLAGYRMKKNIKHEVMFQKQDIISYYFDFLSRSPKPVYEPEPEHINIEHPDFVEELERQIEQNMISQQFGPEQPRAVQANTLTVQTSQITQLMRVHFFKGHLDFDLNDLMIDL